MPDCQTSAPILPPVKLLDQVRDRIRRLGYAKRTELSYVHWIKRYIVFQGKRHPIEMGKPEVEAFLTALAVQRNVAASTQNLALSAILFLYRVVLNIPLSWLNEVVRAKKPARLPTVGSGIVVDVLCHAFAGDPRQLLYSARVNTLGLLGLGKGAWLHGIQHLLAQCGRGAPRRVDATSRLRLGGCLADSDHGKSELLGFGSERRCTAARRNGSTRCR